MTGKKWFYWLGKLHGSRKQIRFLSFHYPVWAFRAYDTGWWDGYNEVTQ